MALAQWQSVINAVILTDAYLSALCVLGMALIPEA